MTSLSKKFYMTIGVFILITIVMGGAFFYLLFGLFFPLADRFFVIQKNLAIFERDSQYYRVVVVHDLEASSPYVSEIKKMFYTPSSKNSLSIILFFEESAKRNGVKVALSQAPDIPQVDLQVSGSLENILKFLRELENDSYLLTVTHFGITPGGGDMYSAGLSIAFNTR